MNPNYITLFKTSKYELKHLYEDAYLTGSGETIFLGSMYGEPVCALIDADNKWCIVGGTNIILWVNNKVTEVNDPDLRNIHSVKQKDKETVELLTDPWSANPAVWSLNVITGSKQKLREFNDYKNKPYTDVVKW